MEAETNEDLLGRIQDLQLRLDEAEETLRALRSGEVDAVVASGPDGDSVYTLRGADETYRLMVQTMTEGAVTLTPGGMILFSNEQFASLLGVPLERLVGSSLQDFIENAATLSAILADSAAAKIEARLKRSPSASVPVQISCHRMALEGIECIYMIVTDLSKLRESEEQYRLLVESITDYAILMLDAQGLVSSWTCAAERIKGYSAGEILGKSFECFYVKADIDHGRPQDALQIARREGRFEEDGWRVRKDGSLFWANVTITAVYDGSGAISGFSKITSDISERKRTDEALRKSEAQLQTIVESLDEGVVVSDLNGRLLRFNRAARDLHGFTSPEECLRCAPEFADTFELKAMDGAILPLDQWPVSRILRHGALRDMEVRIRRIHGDWERVFNYGGALVKDITGQPLMVVITIADITARKRAAEEIRQLNAELEDRVVERTAQLQSANQELEAFSYSVSHDLRAPLRAVDGFSQALLEDYGPLLPAEGKRYLNTIREGTQRMGALIDDLLAFARLSRQPLNKSSVDTGKLVRNVLEDLSMQREGRQIELRIGDLSPCQGDPSLLMQVWTNLLSNALKYTRRRESAVVEVGCASGAGETVYFVRDNGTGFDMQYADKLFGVFQRFHHAEEFEGTGVGLAIAERVIHRHGGRIWADAAVDRGATFYFNLGVEKV
jgi:PAS domain S-box-containing protein